MPDVGANTAKLEALVEALARGRGAFSKSTLSGAELQHVEQQFRIIDRIAHVAIPDWSHIHSLITRLNHRLGDRAPAVSEPLRAWAVQNAPTRVPRRM
jgi:hypothetical protein